MASIVQAQAAIAAALAPAGFNVRPEPVPNPRAGDGWANVGRVVIGQVLGSADCTFTVVLVLGSDARAAATQIRALPVLLLDLVTTGALHAGDVAIEPAELPAGDVAPASLFALIITLTLEVDS
jgi:hypothetical protein